MRIPLAKYGWKEILGSLVISAVTGYLLYLVYPWLVVLPALFMLFTLYFFRDPERKIPESDNLILSPADGRIIEITDVTENEFLKGPALKIAIFLSVFNVHINRAPLTGKVALINYRKGKFLVASELEASSQNESNTIGLTCNNGTAFGILLRQVSGILARRIVCACEVGSVVEKGARIGMIKFGSRTEIYLPKDKVGEITVKLGDNVKGGQTILGYIKQ